jgi:hypothetical protein
MAYVAVHPLRDPTLLIRGFGLSAEFLAYHQTRRPWTLGQPEPYGWLGAQGEGSVVETPVRLFPNVWVRPLRAWAREHGRRVRVIPAHDALRDPRLGLRTVVAFDPAALLASDDRFVIVHTDPLRWREPTARAGPNDPVLRRRAGDLRRMGREQARDLGLAFGPADSRGDGVAIWDLDRVRAAAGAQPAPR